MMLRVTIGKRFVLLRDELNKEAAEPWTQSLVAAATGLTTNQVARLEQSGAGSIEAFITLLQFYQNRGYNLNWVLAEDNELFSKLHMNENTKLVETQAAIAELEALKGRVVKTVSESLDSVIEKLQL